MTDSELVPNLDALDRDELASWRRRWSPYGNCEPLTPADAFAARQQRVEALAAEMFPAKPAGYREAFSNLRAYATLKYDALSFRLAGKIGTALALEARCDSIYKQLPDYARW
jgi:hypothetical protein